jgi:hypothetical protein
MESLLQFGKLQQLPEMIGQSMSVSIQIPPSLLAQALKQEAFETAVNTGECNEINS